MTVSTALVGGGERRSGSGDVRFDGKRLVYSERYRYLVVDTSTAGDRAERDYVLFNTPGLPIPGYTYNSAGLPCSSSSAKRTEINSRYWDIEVEFSSVSNDQSPDTSLPIEQQADPTTWLPVWKMSYETLSNVMLVDANGFAAKNSIGRPFDSGLETYETVVVFEFHQYVYNTMTEKQVCDLNSVVNKTAYKGFPAYTLLLEVKGSEIGVFNGYEARRIDFQVKYKLGPKSGVSLNIYENVAVPAGFTLFNDNCGWRRLRLNSSPYHIESSLQRPFTDDSGSRLSQGVIDLVGLKTTTPTYLVFDSYKPVEFNGSIRKKT